MIISNAKNVIPVREGSKNLFLTAALVLNEFVTAEDVMRGAFKALENRSACLMSNHGQVAFGKNLDQAFELAQEIENICHQYTIALKLGEPKILSFEEMKKVLEKARNYKKG